jgi:hypothetical protein
MRSALAIAAIAQLAALASMGEPVADPREQPTPEPEPMIDDRFALGALRMEAALRPKRAHRNLNHQPTRDDAERWAAEREAKRAAKAAKALAIRDAQRARGQHVA